MARIRHVANDSTCAHLSLLKIISAKYRLNPNRSIISNRLGSLAIESLIDLKSDEDLTLKGVNSQAFKCK